VTHWLSIAFPVALVVAVVMDLWAAFLHGRVWHAWLWFAHRSHHEARVGRFEVNDALSLAHAPIAMALIMVGCQGRDTSHALMFGSGVGMTLFGVAYVIFHDGLVHERLPVRALLHFRIVRRVVAAHRVHHARGSFPYGFFVGPWELRRSLKHARLARLNARSEAPIAPHS
jgi:beta-carotene 3-hydroxylase